MLVLVIKDEIVSDLVLFKNTHKKCLVFDFFKNCIDFSSCSSSLFLLNFLVVLFVVLCKDLEEREVI